MEILDEYDHAISAQPVLRALSVVSAKSRPCGGIDQARVRSTAGTDRRRPRRVQRLGRQSGGSEKGVGEIPIGSEGTHSGAPGHRGLGACQNFCVHKFSDTLAWAQPTKAVFIRKMDFLLWTAPVGFLCSGKRESSSTRKIAVTFSTPP